MQRKIGIDIHRLDNRIRRCVQRTASQHEMEAVSGTNGRIIRFLSEHTDRDIYQKDLESEFGIEVEDEVTAYLTYRSGATGVFVTTTGETPGTNRLEISGTGGKLLCEGDKLYYYKNKTDSGEFSRTAKEAFGRPEVVCEEPETDGKNPQHAGIINNFANALLGLEPFFVDGREGINGVELMNAIELSGWRGGEEVSLPVDGEEYLRELTARRATSRVSWAQS